MVAMGVPSLADEDLEENMPTMRPTMPPPPPPVPVPALGVPLSLLLPPTEERRPVSLPCAELSMDPAPDLELLLSPPLPLATEARRPPVVAAVGAVGGPTAQGPKPHARVL